MFRFLCSLAQTLSMGRVDVCGTSAKRAPNRHQWRFLPHLKRASSSGVVGIEIDVDARNSIISKLEHVAEASARGFPSLPGFSRNGAAGSAFDDQIVRTTLG